MSALQSTRDLVNELGGYLDRTDRVEAGTPVLDLVTGLNPRAWPPCQHCGGNVSCEAYEPDTNAPLWGQDIHGEGIR